MADVVIDNFLVAFSFPVWSQDKYKPNFHLYPVITDVTYKAIQGEYYTCTSVINNQELKKHVVIFQAVSGGLSAKFYKRYFELFFDYFMIPKEIFL